MNGAMPLSSQATASPSMMQERERSRARARRNAKVAIGTKGNTHLERKIRVHANFAEYVPLALLLATFIEMQGRPAWFIHLLCLALVAGRVVHAYGVSQEHERISGCGRLAWRRPSVSLR